ncbi:tetratricopeptide repeat protein [Lutibacter sp.]|uniref:tetratricopeptide repeat protein n=1 Tax=Lutibacter sp. TaxID=1925666 RepID=UPI0035615FCE
MKKIIIILLLVLVPLKTEAQSSVFAVVDSLLLKGNYQKALVLLENSEPKTFAIFEKTASIYQSVGNENKALSYLNKALKLENSETAKVKLAQLYLAIGLTSKAMGIYENLLVKDTSNLLVANSLGKLYVSQNQPKRAEKLFRFLQRKDTLNPNYPYQIGECLDKQNKFNEMGQSYLNAYKLDTLHLKSIFELAKFFKTLRFQDSTTLFINKGLQIDANNINFNQLKANDLYFAKDFKNTLTYLKKLDSLNYVSVSTYEMAGMCYYNLQEFDLAETYFKKAIRLDPNDYTIYYRLATLYYDKKDYEKAEHYLTFSIFTAKPDIDRQYLLMGIIHKQKNNLKEAIDDFEEAYKNNYKNYKALFELATTSDLYYEDKKMALKRFQQFVAKFKRNDEIMTTYAEGRIKEIKKQYFLEGEIVD